MKTTDSCSPTRRMFLRTGLATGAFAFAAVPARLGAEAKKEDKMEEIPPTEDLMREHGVLKRVLLIYEEVRGRLQNSQEFSPKTLLDAAGIIRRFIEDYHEKLEEDFLFPRFEKARQHLDLTRVLREQHQAGRRLTDVTAVWPNWP